MSDADGQAARRERKTSPTSEHSEEDGEISHRDREPWRRSPSRDRDRDRSPIRKSSPKKAEKQEADLDAVPANSQELNAARLSRYELVDIMFKDGWEEVASGELILATTAQAGEADTHGRGICSTCDRGCGSRHATGQISCMPYTR